MFKKISVALGIFVALALTSMPVVHAEDAEKVKPTSEYVVNDYAGILDQKTKDQIINHEEAFKNTKRQPQIVVMTIKNTNGQTIADWSDDLLLRKEWKFGKKGEDNGVLILFAQNGGKNNVRISTGYGVEDILTDQKAHDILESHLDDLKSSDNAKVNIGIRAVDQAVNQLLMKRYANSKKDDFQAKYAESAEQVERRQTFKMISIILIIIVLIILIQAIFKNNNGNHHGGSGGGGNELFSGWALGSLFSSSSSSNWGNDSSWGDSGDWSDSGGGGDFGGGGSDI